MWPRTLFSIVLTLSSSLKSPVSTSNPSLLSPLRALGENGILLGVVLFFVLPIAGHAQSYDLLIEGGHVIDPKNGVSAPRDVAIRADTIARVADDLPASDAETVIDATGLYVTPGLIDIHAHVFSGSRPEEFADGFSSVSPDAHTFRSGITTIVDAGTSGWRTFPDFKKQIIDPSDTRVLAFLNIVGQGMWDENHNQDLREMQPTKVQAVAEKYPDHIVGVKIGHYRGESWLPFGRALGAARLIDSPLLLECHLPELPLKKLLRRMGPGDIFTHAFADVGDRNSMVDEEGQVREFVWEAKENGVVFDVGHGGGSFHYGQAAPALEQGLAPDAFGTDLHHWSMNDGMKNMLNIMSKYLNLGMELREVIARGTWSAAQAIGREDLGHLSEGAVADVAILRKEEGTFGFVDAGGEKLVGNRKLQAELTLRAGRVVWDLNGLAAPVWRE